MKPTDAEVTQKSELILTARQEIGRVVVGQEYLIERLLIALLCNGHVLIEGVPGLAKTLSVTTLARTVKADFQRIQFTPDLLPADLTGTLIYNQKTGNFIPRKGPIFANIILSGRNQQGSSKSAERPPGGHAGTPRNNR